MAKSKSSFKEKLALFELKHKCKKEFVMCSNKQLLVMIEVCENILRERGVNYSREVK